MKTIELHAFLAQTTLDQPTLERWIERRWIVSTHASPLSALTEADAARVLLIRELNRDFGVNEEGIDIVLHLLDQLHGTRRALQALRAQIGTASANTASEDDDRGG